MRVFVGRASGPAISRELFLFLRPSCRPESCESNLTTRGLVSRLLVRFVGLARCFDCFLELASVYLCTAKSYDAEGESTRPRDCSFPSTKSLASSLSRFPGQACSWNALLFAQNGRASTRAAPVRT